MDNYVVVKKKNTLWKVIGIILAIGALCVIAAMVYEKFFKNRKPAVCEADTEELPASDEAVEEAEAEEAEALVADAEAVIADSENMEEAAN